MFESFSVKLIFKWSVVMAFTVMSLSMYPANAFSQVSAFTYQDLSFGAFYPGAGGTIRIDATGSRTVTGGVIPVNMGFLYFPAIFEIECPEGTILNVVKGPDTQLTGSNGGSMLLSIGTADPAFPIITSATAPDRTTIKVGADLTVGDLSANPPGTYQGTFSITFVQE